MSKVWEVAPRKFDDLVDQLLYNRGVILKEDDEDKKLEYFHPGFDEGLHDPFLMKNLEHACKRIQKAKENNEIIGIFADYDADGIPGAALMYRTLRIIGFKPIVYIPNREGGYGLSKEGIDYLANNGVKLIITIDLGIRNLTEPDYCREKGIDLIISDHHLPGDTLPAADFVINPKQKGDEYPFKDLCGCGVAYKIIQGLSNFFPEKIDEKFLKWNLDLVAISTISDVVPLSGENRVLAKYGLKVISKTKNIGLAALIKVAGLRCEEISAYHVGFQIGPRINAPGRIECATKSFELLVTEDETEARDLALSLNEQNEERQIQMERVQREAIALIEEKGLEKDRIIIVNGKWQKGVIGPSASRIVEKYHRPAILFAEEDDCFTGSARSVSGVNIVSIFEKIKDDIAKFGGHKGAAGITVKKAKFKDFLKHIKAVSEKDILDEALVPKVRVDAEVQLSELTKSLYEKIILFEPFGMENSKPVFIANDSRLDFTKFVGKNSDHFSALVGENPHRLKMIHFFFPYNKDMIKNDLRYDLVFTLSLDEWQGKESISLNVLDIRIHVDR